MVAEYLISRERGKMLGTLVALALARMPNLESFTWDMPSGVPRDVWLALASLGDCSDPSDCRLRQIWVRWHNNSHLITTEGHTSVNSASVATQTSAAVGVGISPADHSGPTLPQQHGSGTVLPAASRTERPTLSILPALESLTVLDIDELAYLDEMSFLIARSQHRLRELRIGIAVHAVGRDWVKNWYDNELLQVDHNATWMNPTATAGEKRLGGVLGIILGRVHDLHQRLRLKSALKAPSALANDQGAVGLSSHSLGMSGHATVSPTKVESESASSQQDPVPQDTVNSTTNDQLSESTVTEADMGRADSSETLLPIPKSASGDLRAKFREQSQQGSAKMSLCGKLNLEVLELERVPLYVPALHKALDWTVMTSLTILNCVHSAQLWKGLRRLFGPPGLASSTTRSSHGYKLGLTLVDSVVTPDQPSARRDSSNYPLKLKKIHTDMVSPSLISFLCEALAPNSLEVLFLQEADGYASSVTIKSIYRGALIPHRKSLKTVLIDSSKGSFRQQHGDVASEHFAWEKWLVTNKILSFLGRGKMPALREIGMAIDYKDWVSRITHLILFLSSET